MVREKLGRGEDAIDQSDTLTNTAHNTRPLFDAPVTGESLIQTRHEEGCGIEIKDMVVEVKEDGFLRQSKLSHEPIDFTIEAHPHQHQHVDKIGQIIERLQVVEEEVTGRKLLAVVIDGLGHVVAAVAKSPGFCFLIEVSHARGSLFQLTQTVNQGALPGHAIQHLVGAAGFSHVTSPPESQSE